ncbi:MAG: hypothetical protein WCQ52_00730 [Actinomycetes bacterium]
MKTNLKSDSGYTLGLVLIFVLAVGTVLGSVMMVTQLSADAQGRGVEQLTASNDLARSKAEIIELVTSAVGAGDALNVTTHAANCGLPSHDHDVTIHCVLIPSSDSSSYQQVLLHLTDKNGHVDQDTYLVTSTVTDVKDPESSRVEHFSGFGS